MELVDDRTAEQKLLLGPQTSSSEEQPPENRNQEILLNIQANTAAVRSPVPNRSTFVTAQKTVRQSGIPEQLPNFPIPDGFALVIKAKKANTGTVTVGYSSGAASHSGSDYFSLAANESVKYNIQNANQVWIDVTVAGEGVELTAEQ